MDVEDHFYHLLICVIIKINITLIALIKMFKF